MNVIDQRIKTLREKMAEAQIDAYIVFTADAHQSEYVADYWKVREYISGFTGSSGICVITKDKAALWSDFRYYIQGEKETKDSEIIFFKMGMAGVVDHLEFLKSELEEGATIACDGRQLSVNVFEGMEKVLKSKNISYVFDRDLIGEIWSERTPLPKDKIFELELKYSGKERKEKLADIRKEMKEAGADYHLVTTLDDIAWIFNLRGSDIDFNPVFMSYALLADDAATLYLDQNKVDNDLIQKLSNENIILKPYDAIYEDLKAILPEKTIFFDKAKINKLLFDSIKAKVKIGRNFSTPMKAKKNPVEIQNFRNCMIKDGVALTKFYYWVESNKDKTMMDELSLADKLLEFRSRQEGFVQDSFNYIVGFKEHGALCHYAASEETKKEVKGNGLLLIDSGGQYLEGTTDITRVISFGKPTEQEVRDFTLVLKGMLKLAMAVFPEGTKGVQLDTYARMDMWKEKINFGHGTGHGVGAFLNVHEGPQNISPGLNPNPMEEGMVTSDEPGIYREGSHGIRIENLILTKSAGESEFGKFLDFEIITLCYIDPDLIDKNILSEDEIEYLNKYHQTVFEKVSPFLTEDEKKFLKEKTRSL